MIDSVYHPDFAPRIVAISRAASSISSENCYRLEGALTLFNAMNSAGISAEAMEEALRVCEKFAGIRGVTQ